MKSFVLAAATVATFAIFGPGSEAEAGHCRPGRSPIYGDHVYGPGFGPVYSTHHYHHGYGYGHPGFTGYGYRGYGYGPGYHGYRGYRGYRGSSFGISTPSFGLYVR